MRLGEVLLQAPYLPVTPVSIKDVIFNHPGTSALLLSPVLCTIIHSLHLPVEQKEDSWNQLSVVQLLVWVHAISFCMQVMH